MADNSISAPSPTWGATAPNLGKLGASRYYDGLMDEVQIFNSTLNGTAVRNLYNYNTDQGEGSGGSIEFTNTSTGMKSAIADFNLYALPTFNIQ